MLSLITAPVRTIRIFTPESLVLTYNVEEKTFALELDKKELDRRKDIQNEIEIFKKENSALAEDPRFCDAYYFRLSQFYALQEDWLGERECLRAIRDKENPAFAERLAQNALRLDERSEENCRLLYDLNTESSIRKLAGFYMADGDFGKAKRAFGHWAQEHDMEKAGYELLCQAGLLCVKTGKLENALHLMRRAFFKKGTSELALMLATIYYALNLNDLNSNKKSARRKNRLLKKAKNWLKVSLSLDPGNTGAVKLACQIYFSGRKLGDGGESLAWLSEKLKGWISLASSRESHWCFKGLLNLGLAYFIDGKFEKCLAVLRAILDERNFFRENLEMGVDKTDALIRNASVWHNIALCQYFGAKSRQEQEQSRRSIERAVKKCAEAVNDVRQRDFVLKDERFCACYEDIRQTAKYIEDGLKGGRRDAELGADER